MRFTLAFLFLLLPAALWAGCSGSDLRNALTPQERSSIEQATAALPFAEGNHWIARRGSRTVHVIGTMHLYDPRMDRILARLAPVIEGADVLLLEANAGAEARFLETLSRNPSLTLITEGPTLIDRLPAEQWEALAGTARSHGIPEWMAAKMRPWFLTISLSVPPCLRSDPAALQGLDKRLEKTADQAGVETGALEDPLTLIATLNADPLEEQIRELQAMLALTRVDGDDFRTMSESYFDEQSAFFLEMAKQEFLAQTGLPQAELLEIWDESLKALTTTRNLAWMPVIEAAAGDQIVVAAGALHLPGDYGVLNLLQQQGYRLERAPF